MPDLISDDGVRIAYHEFGDATPTAGRPLVVLNHGFVADTHLNWVLPGIVDALVAGGRRVVGIDARGHGASDAPHELDRYGEARMAADVVALTTALGADTYDLAGYSMGGIVSVLTAVRDPRVRRMVVGGIGSAIVELGGVDTNRLSNLALAQALEADDVHDIASAEARLFRRFADSTGGDRFALAAQARSVHASPMPLERITAPTLLLVGADDPLATRPQVLVDAIAGATLRVVTGDHLTTLSDPAFAPTLVDFLGQP